MPVGLLYNTINFCTIKELELIWRNISGSGLYCLTTGSMFNVTAGRLSSACCKNRRNRPHNEIAENYAVKNFPRIWSDLLLVFLLFSESPVNFPRRIVLSHFKQFTHVFGTLQLLVYNPVFLIFERRIDRNRSIVPE